jgi:hypothetical protein
MSNRSRWTPVLVGAALLAVATTAACTSPPATPGVAHLSGPSGTGTSTTLSSNQADQDFVDFARCLRARGVNEPDPAHRPGHVGLSVEIPPAGPSTNAALTACNHFIAPIMQMKQAHAQQELASWLPALTRYAQCMRSHDIAMLDPGSQGQLNLGNVPGITNDFGRYSPQFRAADRACRHLLPAGVHDDGTGP